jgi:hypothetical protein
MAADFRMSRRESFSMPAHDNQSGGKPPKFRHPERL